ncbi:hypothetical protein RvY_18345 [Ramazzottius varieornatus]|uniref:Fork-head domain-containing protein n=1 Tax=Ramazzottius varieornatus TaxID=947166 RepID=A0A1D1W5E7_RAMVA|nr:hypothetical protein RvY_18345 [Ramazzottius varieornatus]
MTDRADTGWPENMVEADDETQFKKLFDLYGLGVDIADISFELLDICSENLVELDSSFTTPNGPLVPENTKAVSDEIALPNIEQFHQQNDQQSSKPNELMFSPNMYAHDQLAFSDYMMVHSTSGMPAMSADGRLFVQPLFTPQNVSHGQTGHFSFHSLPPSPVDSNFFFEQQPQSAPKGPLTGYPAGGSKSLKKCKTSPVSLTEHRAQAAVRKYSADLDTPKENLTVDVDELWPADDNVFSDDEEEVEEGEFGSLDEVGKEGKKRKGAEKVEENGGTTYPKPPYSYSSLVALALKNSRNGRMTVRDIYNFMCNHFPYFRTAAVGWKNSVRHNLSLNPAFLKIVGQTGPARARTACRWTINPDRFNKVTEEIARHRTKSLSLIQQSMRNPELLKQIEEGTVQDFSNAIKGVTVEEKRPGDRRRRSPKKPKSRPGSPLSMVLVERPAKATAMLPVASRVPPNQRVFRHANYVAPTWDVYYNQKSPNGTSGPQGSFGSQENFPPYGRSL